MWYNQIMNIEKVYEKYRLMPNLKDHMYKVTAVASILCDHFPGMIDRKSVLHTCLLHDMGNIVKFNLDTFPEFVKEKGKDYWQKVKDECIEKYGSSDDHKVTLKIAEEIGASLRTLELLNSDTFKNATKVLKSDEMEKKICLYADMRVSPTEIVTLDKRIENLNERYKNTYNGFNGDDKEDNIIAMKKIEEEIFKNIDISPEFINERNILNILSHLKNINIH